MACGAALLLSTVLLGTLLLHSSHTASAAVGADPRVQKLMSDWEPELYAELGSVTPQWVDKLRSPCVRGLNGLRCVPGAFILGNWQSNLQGLGALVGSHPNISQAQRSACFQTWTNDADGRRWLRQPAPSGFDPRHQLLAALGCVTQLVFYPGFAGRFHKYWERSYWPCKRACMQDKACERSYFAGKVWQCKGAALAEHDRVTTLPAVSSFPALNVTPPHLMSAFYGQHVRLIAVVRSPVDRVRHAFHAHPHYKRHYGSGEAGLRAYVAEQSAGWSACARVFGVRRCAIHFEQLGPQPNDVFFHADQLVRGMYAPFVADWLAAFPNGALLLLRTEDLLDERTRTLSRVWAHLGLPDLAASTAHASPRLARAEARLPGSYAVWTRKQGPIDAETTAALRVLYAPFNRELRAMLLAAQPAQATTCNGADAPSCDAFLFEGVVD